MTKSHHLVQENVGLLEQGLDLLQRFDAATYAESPWIGPHLRHALDHYAAFFLGLEHPDTPTLDYDVRVRDRRIETECQVAQSVIATLIDRFADLDPDDLDRPIRLRAEDAAYEGEIHEYSLSTIRRELQFLASHTVHHWALIAARLAPLGVDLGEEFGVAPSTLAYRRRCREREACALPVG